MLAQAADMATVHGSLFWLHQHIWIREGYGMDLARTKDYVLAFLCLLGSPTICIAGIIIYHNLK